MADVDDIWARLEKLRPNPKARDWFRVEAKASGPAEVWIYDEIGMWGTTAKDFAQQLAAIDANAITLHLNSPGGDARDGIAIYNSLRDHKASVTVVVDALAASAASVIAQAGDTVRMNRGAQMMVHDASGLVLGNASDMADMTEVLNKASDSLAAIYAARAGGTVAEWRDIMRAETWYTAAEAVDAGLADEMVDPEPTEPPVRNTWDLTVFAYAGRDAAPPPKRHTPKTSAPADVPAAVPTDTKEAGQMDPAKIREALGLSADASDDQVTAALVTAGLATAAPPAPAVVPVQASLFDPPADPPKPAATPTLDASGTMRVDASAWEAAQTRIKALEAQAAKAREAERDQVIAGAVKDGKFAPARREHWVRLWNADPEGARQAIDGLAKNVIPVMASGYAGSETEGVEDEFYAALYGHSNAKVG